MRNPEGAARKPAESRASDTTARTADCYAVLLAAFVSIALYWNTLGHRFVFDDRPGIVNNPLVGHAARVRDLWQLLREPWRPLVQLSYAATHIFFGFNPAVYHATNVALHSANTVLVYGIASQVARLWLPRERRTLFAVAASLIFAAHPLHTEAVAYVWGRSSSLCAFFCFGSMMLLLLGHQERSAVRRYFLFGCALVFGLLAWKCKEEAMTLPIVLAGFLWLAGRKLAAAGVALVPAALVVARWSDISSLSDKVAQNQELVLAGANPALPRAIFFMTEIKCAVFYYLGKFLVPANLNVDPQVESVNRIYDARFLVACVVLAGCAVLAVLMRQREPALSFSLVALLASPLTSYACMPLADAVAEHRVYIAGLGFALIAAWVDTLRPRIGVGALAVAVVALSFTTHVRNKVWADNETLWRDAERKSPSLARPHINLGVALQAAQRYDEAAAEYAHAMTMNPRPALAYSNMSSIRLHMGDADGAEALLNEAIKLSPGRIGPYLNLAAIKLRRGEPREAIEVLTRGEKLGDFAGVHFSKGEALFALGQYGQARDEYNRAVELDPDSVELRHRVTSRMREMESAAPRRPPPP
ncbi:MAG TPA: tetratricopeptide repeat protein [Acidobacteriota bacterium]|nr:tetratricopeptide repeat protein [Acidobacteriota bacterium]